jgi:hypothetical protein
MMIDNKEAGTAEFEKLRGRRKFRLSTITKIFTDSLEWLLAVSRGTGDIE